MDNDQFFRIHDYLNRKRDDILGIKGSEYPAGDGDRLSNFKVVADLLSPLQGTGEYLRPDGNWETSEVRLNIGPDAVAMVYMAKHILSLATFIREGREDEDGREPISGRIADIQNYADLVFALLYEEEPPRTADPLSIGVASLTDNDFHA